MKGTCPISKAICFSLLFTEWPTQTNTSAWVSSISISSVNRSSWEKLNTSSTYQINSMNEVRECLIGSEFCRENLLQIQCSLGTITRCQFLLAGGGEDERSQGKKKLKMKKREMREYVEEVFCIRPFVCHWGVTRREKRMHG